MDDITALRVSDVPADLVPLLDDSSSEVDGVVYEARAEGEDLLVTATCGDSSRTFRLITIEEER